MFQPARMCRMELTLAEDCEDRLLARLHREGVVQIDSIDDAELENRSLDRGNAPQRINDVSLLLLRTRKLIDVLEKHGQRKPPFVDDLLGIERITKQKVEDESFAALKARASTLLADVEEKTSTLEEKRKDLLTREKRTEEQKSHLAHLADLDVDLKDVGATPYTWTAVGIVAEDRLASLKAAIDNAAGANAIYAHAPAIGNHTGFQLTCAIDKGDAAMEALRSAGARILDVQGLTGTPRKNWRKAEEELTRLREEQQATDTALQELGRANLASLHALEEVLANEKERCQAARKSAATSHTATYRLWVPAAITQKVDAIIAEETKKQYVADVDDRPETAPILLSNPGILRRFQVLTKLYGMPRYHQLDPTFLIAPTFALFVGIMLTDFVYGVALVGLGLLLDKKYGIYSEGLKDFATILVACGAATMVFGIATGSYFGDFLGKYLLGNPAGSDAVALWLDPMAGTNAILLLGIAVGAGFLQLMAGHLLGAINYFKYGERKNALINHIAWYKIVFGSILYLASHSHYMVAALPGAFEYIGLAIVIFGVLLLVIKSSFMVIFDIVGLVGNALSYARLLALMLTTAGIAMSFNFLAAIVADIPTVGILFAAVIFIAGHVINLIINGLGAFVHSLRLEYVEFLGTFYDGDGVEFTPFQEKTTYTTHSSELEVV